MTSPFILSIETDAGTYQHGYHLGTIEAVARQIASDHWRLPPKMGRRVVTVALLRDRKLFDCFDGRAWQSEILADIDPKEG